MENIEGIYKGFKNYTCSEKPLFRDEIFCNNSLIKSKKKQSSKRRGTQLLLPQIFSWSMAKILCMFALFSILSSLDAFCPSKVSNVLTSKLARSIVRHNPLFSNEKWQVGISPTISSIHCKSTYGRSALLMVSDIALRTTATAHEIFMPSLSSTMKEGKIVAWNKKIGDRIEIGDTVMIVESDKADMEVESFSEGYLASHLVAEGNSARVGETVGLIAENKDDIPIIQKQGLNCNIPSGDGNRHDGTTIWNVKEHQAGKLETTSSSEKDKMNDEISMDSTKSLLEALRESAEAKEIFMPALSSTMKTGKIAKWLKKEGDRISVGDVALIVESDKADMDVECFEEGYIAQILVKEGEEARVGETVALISPTIEKIDTIRRLGVSVIQSGSDKRHDMTTAVFDRSTENRGPIRGSTEGIKTSKQLAPQDVTPSEIDATDIFMPALSSTMKEGKIVKWLKKPGDEIKSGDSLMIVESDKADMEVEAFDDGYLAVILAEEGATMKVLDPVGKIVANKDDIARLNAMNLEETVVTSPANAGGEREGKKLEATSTPFKQDSSFPSFQAERKTTHPTLSPNEQRLVDFVPASVDQDIQEQLPKDFSVEQLAEVFIDRIKKTEEGRKLLEEKESSKTGAAQWKASLDRVKLRIPPLNILADEKSPRVGSLWQVSGKARAACDKLNVSYAHINEHNGGRRIFYEDVSAYKKSIGNTAWGRDAYHAKQTSSTLATKDSDKRKPSLTPSARLLAKEKGLNPTTLLTGTGPYGRITQQDVAHHLGIANPLASLPPAGEKPTRVSLSGPLKEEGGIVKGSSTSTITSSERQHASSPKIQSSPTAFVKKEVPMDAMQVAIARNMEATLNAPVFRVSRALITTKLDDLYKQLKPSGVTMSALLVKAVALTLEKHPLMNAAYSATNGGSIRYPNSINIAMAVALENGLITPVLQRANEKSILELSQEWKELVVKAKEKRLTKEEYTTGTFVLSNLGMYGIQQFDAILPQGVGTIMAIAASQAKVIELSDGEIDTRNEMTVTVTCDHRHIYGLHAAQFLQDLNDLIENHPLKLLL